MYNSHVKKQILRSNILKCKNLNFYEILKFYIKMLNWTQLTFFTYVFKSPHVTFDIESHKSASAHVYFDTWTKILR